MTKLLERAMEAVRQLPPAQQDEIAQAILDLAVDLEGQEEEIDADDLPGLLEGLADADAGRFATDEQVEAAFRRFGK